MIVPAELVEQAATRRMESSARAPADPVAVASVLVFGAMPPTRTPWQSFPMPAMPKLGIMSDEPESPDAKAPSERAEMERTLDGVLRDVTASEKTPVVLFSGGVDSGLLAARLKAVGRDDTILVNYSFSPDNPETAIAHEMARRIGLRLVALESAPGDLFAEVLGRPADTWPVPFGDHSVAPTSELVRQVLAEFPPHRHHYVEGTGADGGFGMHGSIQRWLRVQRTPTVMRRTVGALYQRGLWSGTGRIERAARIMRRSTEFGFPLALIAQNALHGTLYDETWVARASSELAGWLGLARIDDPVRRAITADLLVTCALVFAQKSAPVFAKAGAQVSYPYLGADMVRFALKNARAFSGGPSKAVFKESLASVVGPDLVYRKKSGFGVPSARFGTSTVFLDALGDATGSGSALAGMVDGQRIRRCRDRVAAGGQMSPQVMNCLWAVAFSHRWYSSP